MPENTEPTEGHRRDRPGPDATDYPHCAPAAASAFAPGGRLVNASQKQRLAQFGEDQVKS